MPAPAVCIDQCSWSLSSTIYGARLEFLQILQLCSWCEISQVNTNDIDERNKEVSRPYFRSGHIAPVLERELVNCVVQVRSIAVPKGDVASEDFYVEHPARAKWIETQEAKTRPR